MSLPPDDPRHGTVNGYSNLRCRCTSCADAWTTYVLRRRKERAAALDPADPRHGKYSTYINHLCRCADCKGARAEYERGRATHRNAVAS